MTAGSRVHRVLLALLVLAPAAQAATSVPPRPERYATDRAGVVGAARLSALNETLAQFERDTSNQVLVFVDRRLPADTTIEEYATTAFKAWGVGQKDKDNGIAFFVFVDDRQMRIEVGYGLEGALPDIRAASIIEDHAKPRFRANDFAGGVEAAADQMMRAARGEPYQGTGRTRAESGPGADGPPPFWYWLVPLAALMMAGIVARGGTTTADRLSRFGATAGIVTLVLSMVATVVTHDGRLIALGFGFLLLGLVPTLGSVALREASPGIVGRRAAGRLVAIVSGCLVLFGLGAACFVAALDIRTGPAGYVMLAGLFALPVGGLLYARDPAETLTIIAHRLAAVVCVPSALFAAVCTALGATEMLARLLDWLVPSVVVLIASVIYARARGWRLWPKGGGRSYGGSGYSSGSSWSSGSSSSGSSGGSSYSGGGGSSGGGGASGSW